MLAGVAFNLNELMMSGTPYGVACNTHPDSCGATLSVVQLCCLTFFWGMLHEHAMCKEQHVYFQPPPLILHLVNFQSRRYFVESTFVLDTSR
jgi:hypothetical protein